MPNHQEQPPREGNPSNSLAHSTGGEDTKDPGEPVDLCAGERVRWATGHPPEITLEQLARAQAFLMDCGYFLAAEVVVEMLERMPRPAAGGANLTAL